MPINLTESEKIELFEAFKNEINYESDDPEEPINIFTYIDTFGDNCLHIAARRGDVRSVNLLLKAGLNVNQTGERGNTALSYAKAKGYQDIVQLLLDNGAV